MDDTSVTLEGTEVAIVAPAGAAGHAHPGARRYVEVAAALALVTAVEVALYYTSLSGLLLVSVLVGLAAIKFGMVAAYFMHLKFDARLLRRLFVTGIVLAISVFTIALVTLDVLIH
ncbi:MAG: cytochrome C oxidase subunit IV family protein [Acidimicrobiia bacterium]